MDIERVRRITRDSVPHDLKHVSEAAGVVDVDVADAAVGVLEKRQLEVSEGIFGLEASRRHQIRFGRLVKRSVYLVKEVTVHELRHLVEERARDGDEAAIADGLEQR